MERAAGRWLFFYAAASAAALSYDQRLYGLKVVERFKVKEIFAPPFGLPTNGFYCVKMCEYLLSCCGRLTGQCIFMFLSLMAQTFISMLKSASLNDIDWFDAMCGMLKKNNCPLANQLSKTIGIVDNRFSKENRGSKFLVPFDSRFKTACINPDLLSEEIDKPVEYLSFGGTDFSLRMTDIIQRFPAYRIQQNIYDGGTQIFFYPIPKQFEFSALSFHVEQKPVDIGDINSLIFHHVAFHFGDNIILRGDGYHVQR